MNKILVTLCVLLLPFVFSTCDALSDKGEKANQQKKEEVRQQVSQLAAKHNADIQWITFAEEKVFFTIELQRALFNPPGRSRLMIASIVDVIQQDDEFFFTAVGWMYGIYYQLQCTEEQLQYVLNISKNNTSHFEEYAIVMNPRSVHKPVAQLVGELDIDYAYITHEVSDLTVVKGTCLDVLSIDSSVLEIEDLLDSMAEIDAF